MPSLNSLTWPILDQFVLPLSFLIYPLSITICSLLFTNMIEIGNDEICFTKLLHTVLFLMSLEEGFIGVNDWFLYLHFSIELGPLVLVDKEEYDNDMVHIQTIYHRQQYLNVGVFHRIIPGFYKFQWLGESLTPTLHTYTGGARSTSYI